MHMESLKFNYSRQSELHYRFAFLRDQESGAGMSPKTQTLVFCGSLVTKSVKSELVNIQAFMCHENSGC